MMKRVLVGLAVVGLLAWAAGLATAQAADGPEKKQDKKADAKTEKKSQSAEDKEGPHHKGPPYRGMHRPDGPERSKDGPQAWHRPPHPPMGGPGGPGPFGPPRHDGQRPDFRRPGFGGPGFGPPNFGHRGFGPPDFARRGFGPPDFRRDGFEGRFRGEFHGQFRGHWPHQGYGPGRPGMWGPMARRPGGPPNGCPWMQGPRRPGMYGPMRPPMPRVSPEEIFKKMDANGDGSISKEEFLQAHKKMTEFRKKMTKRHSAAMGSPGGRRPGPPGAGPHRPPMADILKKLDKNGDGKLTKDEVPEKLWEHLAKADANKDGAVTKEEIAKAREQMREKFMEHRRPGPPGAGPGGPPRHRFDPGAMFKRADKNGDGKLAKDEVPEKVWEHLAKADANKDGAVTPEELKKSFHERFGRGEKAEKK